MNQINVELLNKGQLTDREGEVLREVCAGRSDKEITRILGCSIRTVTCHIDHIYEKLEIKGLSINTRCTAISLSVARGMVRCSMKNLLLLLLVIFMVAQNDDDCIRLRHRIRLVRSVACAKRVNDVG